MSIDTVALIIEFLLVTLFVTGLRLLLNFSTGFIQTFLGSAKRIWLVIAVFMLFISFVANMSRNSKGDIEDNWIINVFFFKLVEVVVFYPVNFIKDLINLL